MGNRIVRIVGSIVGSLLVLGLASWWFFLRPPAGVRLALAVRPHLNNPTSRAHYMHVLEKNLKQPPRTTTGLFQQTDEWGTLAGLASVKSTTRANAPLPTKLITSLKRTPWPGPVPTTPRALSVALSSVANTAALANTAHWVQTSIPATTKAVTATANSRSLWQTWQRIPTQPVTAIPALQQFVKSTSATWANGTVSLASVELVMVANQQLEADDAVLNGAATTGLIQAAIWRQVGLRLPADWTVPTTNSSRTKTSGAVENTASPPFASPPVLPDGEIAWTITTKPNTSTALAVLAVNQLSQAFATAMSLKSTLSSIPEILKNVAELPHEIGVLKTTTSAIIHDGINTSEDSTVEAAKQTWADMTSLQKLWGIKSDGTGLGASIISTAQTLIEGQSAFPLHAIWFSSRYGSLSGTPVVNNVAHLTTDAATDFPHSAIWVEGSPFRPNAIKLSTNRTVVTAVLNFPGNVLWDSMALDTARIMNVFVSDLLDADSIDTLGLSFVVKVALGPLINHVVIDGLKERVTAAQNSIPSVPVVASNSWVLPATIQQTLSAQGAWAGTVWTLSNEPSEAFVAYFDSAIEAENLAIVSATGQVLWQYWTPASYRHKTLIYARFNENPIHVWFRPAEREAVVSITVSGLDAPNRQLFLFRWAPNSATPQVSEINAKPSPSTPALSLYTLAKNNISSSFGNIVGIGNARVGPNGTIYIESLNSMAGFPGEFTLTPTGTTSWARSTNTMSINVNAQPSLPTPIALSGSVGTRLPYRAARNSGADELLGGTSTAGPMTLWTDSTLQGISADIGESPAATALQAAQEWANAMAKKQYQAAWALMTPAFRWNPGSGSDGAGGYFGFSGGWGSLRGLEASGAPTIEGITANGLTPEKGQPNTFTEFIKQPANRGFTNDVWITITCTDTPQGWLVNNLSTITNLV